MTAHHAKAVSDQVKEHRGHRTGPNAAIALELLDGAEANLVDRRDVALK